MIFKIFVFCFSCFLVPVVGEELVKEMVVTADCPYVSFCEGVEGVLVYQETKHTARITGMIYRKDHKTLFSRPLPYNSRNVKIGGTRMIETDLLKIERIPSVEQTVRILDFGSPLDIVAKWDGYVHLFIPTRGSGYKGDHIHIDLSWIHSIPEEVLVNRLPNDGSLLVYER